MTDISARIKDLERDMSISTMNPLKVVAIIVGVVGVVVLASTWWFKPSFVTNEKGEMCSKRMAQFCVAVLVGLASFAWLFWNWYNG